MLQRPSSVCTRASTAGQVRLNRLGRWLLATSLAVAGLGVSSFKVHAANSPANTVVEAVQAPAWVERLGRRLPAQPGQVLREGDKAITAKGARMLLRMPDRSSVKLGEQTELLVKVMELNRTDSGSPNELQTALRLVTGVFRYATDYSSKALGTRRTLNLETATATVGIRGTDFWSMSDAAHDAVCVFEGSVAISRTEKPEIVLNKPGAFWVVFTGQPEQPPGQATPDQLAKFIDQAELSPGKGILLQGGRWRTVAGTLDSASEASALRARLREAGYAADMVVKQGKHEVRVNQLATREDAAAILTALQENSQLNAGNAKVALAAD